MGDFDAESYLAQLTSRPGVYQMFDRATCHIDVYDQLNHQ